MTPDSTNSTELHISRHFAAPPELVYRAFIDPEQLAAWFGPLDFEVPLDTVEVDPRIGGHQRLTMVHTSDPSFTSRIDAAFTEVVENRLLVGFQDVHGMANGDEMVRLTLSVEFLPEGGGTRLELRQGPYTPDIEEDARRGWEESFTKLDAQLS